MKRMLVFMVLTVVATFAFAGGQTQSRAAVAFNRTGLPIVNEPVTLRMSTNLHVDNAPYGDMPFFKMMEERTGVRVTWNMIPANVYAERKTLMLAGGDLPDAMYKAGLTDFEMLTYSQQGAFLGLSEYLRSDLMPHTNAILDQRPSVRSMITLPDDEIYALPWIEEMRIVYSDAFLHVNKTWLDNLGMAPPETTEEFAEMLRRFRDEDANRSGNPNDEIPFFYKPSDGIGWGGHQNGINFMMGSFGRADNQEHIVVENREVVFTADKPEYRTAVNYFADLFAQGLIYEEALSLVTGSDLRNFGLANQDRLGSFVAWRSFSVVSLDKSQEFVEIPPLIGPEGHRQWGRANRDEQLSKSAFVVSAKNPHPEITLRWADYHYDPDMSIQANYGMYDSVLGVNQMGLREMIPSSEWGGQTQNEVRAKASPTNGGPFAILFDYWGDKLYMWEGPAGRQKVLAEVYSEYVSDEYYPQLTFTLEEATELARYQMTIVDYVNQQTTRWVRAGVPITDAEWNRHLQTLNSMGLNPMLAVLQQGYDRYLAGLE